MMNNITFALMEVTTRCNFNCIFCSGRHMEQKDMDFAMVKKVVDTFPYLTDIQLQGEGEPLLHPRFFDMVKYSKNAGLNVITVTNGSLLTDENIMKILDSRLDVIYISIESTDSEMYRSIRRGGDYEKLVSNIKRFVQLKKENNCDKPAIGFAITVMRKTKDMFENIINLYNELGLDGEVMYNCLLKTPDHSKNYGDELKKQTFTCAEEKLIFYENDKILLKNNIKFGKAPDYSNPYNCIWLDHRVSINVNGSCLRCPFDKDETGFIYGNINTDSYEKIADVRAKFINGEIPQPETLDCTKCFIYR